MPLLHSDILQNLEIDQINKGTSDGVSWYSSGEKIDSTTPIDGSSIATIIASTEQDVENILTTAQKAFLHWKNVPAPQRGEIVRQIGNAIREKKDYLGKLVSLEMGKSLQEGLGEVQEMIDICDFAVGLSRQLHGYTMHSERPSHRMYEQYHPIGIVGIISAFNFPVAVWSWNAALAWVCGNVCIWKGSEKTPLCALVCQKIAEKVFKANNCPPGISNLITGKGDIGQILAQDKRVQLLSFTGSTAVGRTVNQLVAQRFGKCILELGGNNAIIITEDADINMAIVASVFGAVGTAGQRCTSTRRLIIHEDIYDSFITSLKGAYAQIKIGNPLDEKNHIGPLIDNNAVEQYCKAIQECEEQSAHFIIKGGKITIDGLEKGSYVTPTVVEAENKWEIVQHETFAPILYVMKYSTIQEAIAMQNDVPQGLSSSIFSNNLRQTELFLSSNGSDCGIANVNIGTSGAEIGGAFGGEKDTGGGRESGSDVWKFYMRRQTNTINYSTQLPLAQGIKFTI